MLMLLTYSMFVIFKNRARTQRCSSSAIIPLYVLGTCAKHAHRKQERKAMPFGWGGLVLRRARADAEVHHGRVPLRDKLV